ncbi:MULTISPECIES: heavy-metal-associated domain-containing protein [Streptomyces]|uniref:heavy-metal-associated domain-containing protein n=1 Tax=Streptomyces TaxID=1883 RepID=UPI00224897B5|nr:heavy-metal-associated domain-containing protein [Streptomyces sp. JHD 1]MCX2968098.1 heavy-metal-associated domain-containing protein [Streptomyces sp. JHD 1]
MTAQPTPASSATDAAEARPRVTVYAVSGMSCGHCEAAVAGELGALESVAGVEVDVAAGRVTVTTAGEPDDALLARAVDEAGYTLTGRV